MKTIHLSILMLLTMIFQSGIAKDVYDSEFSFSPIISDCAKIVELANSASPDDNDNQLAIPFDKAYIYSKFYSQLCLFQKNFQVNLNYLTTFIRGPPIFHNY